MNSPTTRSRHGAAPLELVLALPLLLTLLVALVWLGFSLVGQAEVTSEARTDAWRQRHDAWQPRMFAFSQSQQSDGSAETTVNVKPLLDAMPQPAARSVVEQSSWDHRSVPLDEMPNWRTYVETAVAAKSEGILSTYQDARGQLQQVRATAQSAWADMLRNAANSLSNPLRQLRQANDASESQRDRDQNADDRQRDDRRKRIEDQLRELRNRDDRDDEDDQDTAWLKKRKRERLEIERDSLEDQR